MTSTSATSPIDTDPMSVESIFRRLQPDQLPAKIPAASTRERWHVGTGSSPVVAAYVDGVSRAST